MSYIMTNDGSNFDFDDMSKNTVSIDTTARALCKLNRFTGHTRYPYNVAAHSLLVSKIVGILGGGHDPILELAGLCHDTHESVIGDISTPLKQYLKGSAFDELEWRCQKKFIKDLKLPKYTFYNVTVKIADKLAFLAEVSELFPGAALTYFKWMVSEDDWKWFCKVKLTLMDDIRFMSQAWDLDKLEQTFVGKYNELQQEIQETYGQQSLAV